MSPLLIGILIIVVGIVLAIVGVVLRARAGRIAAAPLAKTGDALRASGLVGVEGTVQSQAPLAAPCTNTPCVAYRFKLERKVKEKKGGQTTTSWKPVAEHHQGSLFALDDGSGALGVLAQDAVDGDLDQTFSGAPSHAMLAQYATSQDPREEVLEYRATEKLVRIGARIFALGEVSGGRLQPPQGKKLLLSTRGRDALIGRSRKIALGMFVAATLVTGAGATVAILRPGEAPACGMLTDQQLARCRVVADTLVDHETTQADGSKKKIKRREASLKWKVTKAAKFELVAEQPKKKNSLPVIQVVDQHGLPRNLDFGIAIGAGRYTTKTKTMTLGPGEYQIIVWSEEAGPSDHTLTVTEVPNT